MKFLMNKKIIFLKQPLLIFVLASVPSLSLSAGTLGLRNFLQITAALSEVTKVDQSNKVIQTYYRKNMGLMSAAGNSQDTSPGLLLAYASLAGVYCQQAFAQENALSPSDPKRVLYKGIDFKSPVSTSMSSDSRQNLVNTFTKRAWGRQPSPSENEILLTSMEEARAAVVADGAASFAENLAAAMAITLCTTTLSSPDFLRN